jgi:hypothetical protein
LKSEIRKSFRLVGSVPKAAITDFKDLEVWKVARELRSAIYGLARLLPDFEKYGLACQLRRAATSVTANIAEGYGRGTATRKMHNSADRPVDLFTNLVTISLHVQMSIT